MSVIVTGMDMPESCFECSTKVDPETRRCNIDGLLFEETLELCTSKRHPDCPLKSVEGLIEKIEKSKVYDNSYMYNWFSYNKGLTDAIEYIKEYCGDGNDANSD